MKPRDSHDELEPPGSEFAFIATQGASQLRAGLASLSQDRWRIGGVFALGMLLTVLAAALAPTRYTAEAELLLRLGREYIYRPETGEPAGGGQVAYDRELTLLAEARILKSSEVLETVLGKLGDERVFPELKPSKLRLWWRESLLAPMGLAGEPATAETRRAAAALLFERALEAELLRGSNLMQVSFRHGDPKLAATVLSEVIETYMDRRSIIFASPLRGMAQANFDSRREQLAQANTKLADFKLLHDIQVFAAEQSLLLGRRSGLDEKRTEAELALARARGRAASLRNSLADAGADVPLSSETQRSDAVEKARSLILDLKLKERELASQFTDDNPAVQDVRADIARTEAYLGELLANPVRTVRSGRSPTRDAAESELLRARADERQSSAGSAALAAERAATERRLAELSAAEPELNALERERRLAEENFNAAAKTLRDELTSAELDRERRSNVSVVQAPRAPASGRSGAGLILGVGGFISLCAALLTAFLLALWRDTFRKPGKAAQAGGATTLAAATGKAAPDELPQKDPL